MESYRLTSQEVRDGHNKIVKNVQNLLDSASLLLNEKRTRPYAVGLYMYAIEEYGKSEILKIYLKEKKTVYSIPHWIFGKGNDKRRKKAHEIKLGEGISRLPSECRLLSPTGVRLEYNRQDKTRTVVIKKNRIPVGFVSIGSYATGTFEDTSIPRESIDYDQKNMFYVDWIDNRWKYVIDPDADLLQSHINLVKRIVTELD